MKILIFGIPGSGKTTLSHNLAKIFDLSVFHIDKHFFNKGWVERDHDHFLEDVRSVFQKDRWIIDGNGMRSIEIRFKETDVAIYCHLPRLLCLYRIVYRWLSTLGKPKYDGPEGSKNTITWKLLKYLWKFPKKYQKHIKNLQKKYPKVRFLEIRSKKEMKDCKNNAQQYLCTLST